MCRQCKYIYVCEVCMHAHIVCILYIVLHTYVCEVCMHAHIVCILYIVFHTHIAQFLTQKHARAHTNTHTHTHTHTRLKHTRKHNTNLSTIPRKTDWKFLIHPSVTLVYTHYVTETQLTEIPPIIEDPRSTDCPHPPGQHSKYVLFSPFFLSLSLLCPNGFFGLSRRKRNPQRKKKPSAWLWIWHWPFDPDPERFPSRRLARHQWPGISFASCPALTSLYHVPFGRKSCLACWSSAIDIKKIVVVCTQAIIPCCLELLATAHQVWIR